MPRHRPAQAPQFVRGSALMNTRQTSRSREDNVDTLHIKKRTGETFYVSKLGDDSDGLSWRIAFRTT